MRDWRHQFASKRYTIIEWTGNKFAIFDRKKNSAVVTGPTKRYLLAERTALNKELHDLAEVYPLRHPNRHQVTTRIGRKVHASRPG